MIKLFSVLCSSVCALSASIGFVLPVKAETRYGTDFQSGTYQGTTTRTVYYAAKDDSDTYVNPYKAPSFMASMSNACAVNAGGNILTYYDRVYDELIPNYAPKTLFGNIIYGSQNDGINNMFSDLAVRMGKTDNGVTIDGFKSGMQSYAAAKSRSAQLTQAKGSYCNLNLDYIKSQLKQEKVAALFLTTFSVTTFGELKQNAGYDSITHSLYSGSHTMMVYGYKDIYYYDANGALSRRDTYLYVSTGFASEPLAFVNINNYCNVDDCYIVSVY